MWDFENWADLAAAVASVASARTWLLRLPAHTDLQGGVLIIAAISGCLLVYLSAKLRLRIALLIGVAEGAFSAFAWRSERWPEPEFLPVLIKGLFLGAVFGGTLGAAVVAIRLFLYLGQDLPLMRDHVGVKRRRRGG